jgi:DNA-binding IclR family transcriptional regulator
MTTARARVARGSGTQGVQSVEIAARILSTFTPSEPILGVTQIGERLGMPKSKVHRFLVSLQRVGFVRRDPITDRYSLGLRLSDLGKLAVASLDVLAQAGDVARRIAYGVDLSTSVAIWTNEGPVLSHVITLQNAVSTAYSVGSAMSLHASAHGKVFLAFLPPEIEERVIFGTLKQLTSHTVTAPQKLKLQLDLVRRDQVAVSRSEAALGLFELASPVFSAAGSIVASLGLGGLSEDIPEQRERDLRKTVVSAATQLSFELGWRPEAEKAGPTGRKRPEPATAGPRTRKPRPNLAADLDEPAASHHPDLQVSFDP